MPNMEWDSEDNFKEESSSKRVPKAPSLVSKDEKQAKSVDDKSPSSQDSLADETKRRVSLARQSNAIKSPKETIGESSVHEGQASEIKVDNNLDSSQKTDFDKEAISHEKKGNTSKPKEAHLSNNFLATLKDVLTPEELEFLETESTASKVPAEDLITRKHLLPPAILLERISSYFNYPIAKDLLVDTDIFQKKITFFIVNNVVPLQDGTFALASPRLVKSISKGLYELGVTKPSFKVAEARKISKTLRTAASAMRLSPEDLLKKIKILCESNQFAKAAYELFHYAFQVFASDLHLERRESHGILRLRVDGVLEDATAMPVDLYERIVGAIYQLTKSQQPNIQESGDGAFDLEDLPLQLRVSFYPSLYASHNIVMRLLPKSQETPTGEDLGYSPEIWKSIVKLSSKSTSGLILYAGPTGSGKTSSLFALLSTIDTKGKKLLEVADPIEYQHMLGVQAQLTDTEKLQWKYADALRAALRHDPDLILVGEIRDPDSAKIALDAARTGHLIFSTVHAETSWEVFDRLQDLGLELKYLLSATKMIVAQRLLRKICKSCFGNGCDVCRQTGYAGRFAIAEVLTMTDSLREALSGTLPPTRVQQEALATIHVPGYTTLFNAAKRAINDKITTLEEAERVLGTFPENL